MGRLIASLLLLFTASTNAQDSVELAGKRAARATVGLIGNQELTADLLDKTLKVSTRYGLLSVPREDIVKVRLTPILSARDKADLEVLLARVGSEKDDGGLDKSVLDEIHRIGLAGGIALIEASAKTADKSRKDDVAAILAQLRKDSSAFTGAFDEIVTKRFTIRGTIEMESFRFHCLAREMSIPRADVRHITYRELDHRKIFKVLPTHMEQQGFLVTGMEVKKGQRFSLTPEGTMTYDGQSFGPTGLTNHTWNSRNVGALQWRIGNGPWKLLNSEFKGKAETKGSLQFSVHMFQATGGGEFKVTFRTRLK